MRILAVLVVVGGSAVALVHYNKPAVAQLYLGADEVQITACQTFGGIGTDVTANLVNPTGRTADLNATVEVDDPAHSSNAVDTVTLVAEDVPRYGSITATGSGDTVNTPPRVTCHVTGIETVPLSP